MFASTQAMGLPQAAFSLSKQSLINQQHGALKPRFLRRYPHQFRVQATSTAISTELTQWLNSQGVDLDRLGVTVGQLNGLIAARPIAKGETAASIPENLWITKSTATQSALGATVADLAPWLAVALFLIHEKTNSESQWAPYIATLPTEVSSPVAWSDAELEQLRGTQLLASVEGYRAFFQERFQDLEANLFASNPEIFPPKIFTWDAFLWAACTVRARSHAPLDGEELALVPLTDLTQHARAPTAGVYWSLKSAGLFGGKRALAVEAERALKQGEPVAMDFGPNRTEGQILLDYGVTDVISASGSFALTITLPEDDRFFDDKIDILEQSGLQQSSEFVLRATGGAPESLLPMLRLVNIQGADAFLLESIFRNEVWEHMQQPVSEDNETAICKSIVDGCASVLAGYPTSLDEDAAALGALAPGSRAAAAVAVRLGEKEALEATLRLFESRLDRMKDLEFYAERRLKRLGLLDKEGKPTDWDSFFEDGIA